MGQIPAAQLAVDAVVDERVDHHEDRHAQQHAPEAEQSRAEDDREHDPEAVDAHRAAQDLRADDVPVDLLEDDDEDQEDQRFWRADHQDDDDAGHRAEQRAEEGDEVRHAHDHADQQRVGHAEDREDDVADDADDGRVQELAVDEADEGAVREAQAVEQLLGRLGGQDAVEYALGPGLVGVDIAEQIEGDDDADDQIVDRRHHIAHAGRDVRQKRTEARQHGRLQPADHVLVHIAQQIRDVAADLREVGEHLRRPVGERLDIRRRIDDDGLDAAVELGDDEEEQARDDGQHEQLGEQHRDGAGNAPAGVAFAPGEQAREQRAEDVVFQRPHQRMQQIGQYQAPDKGAEDADQRVQPFADDADVVERHVKQDGRGDHAKRRDPPVEIFFIPFEIPSHAKPSMRPLRLLFILVPGSSPVKSQDVNFSPLRFPSRSLVRRRRDPFVFLL